MKNKATCEICEFKNPRGTATAVIMRDNKMLLVKRNQEPLKGYWDIPGGYMSEGEKPEQTLEREVMEELGSRIKYDLIGEFPGTATYKEYNFPILSHVYLVELLDDIKLDTTENSEYQWINPMEIEEVSFDSNNDILRYVQRHFVVNFEELNSLIKQLDPSAEVKEHNFYRSVLNGYCSRIMHDKKLVGVGWIFPRQTYLRKQAVIEDVVVDKDHRGLGYGEHITLSLMEWARDNSIDVIELTSGSHRIAANELYKKVGFKLHPTNHYLMKISE